MPRQHAASAAVLGRPLATGAAPGTTKKLQGPRDEALFPLPRATIAAAPSALATQPRSQGAPMDGPWRAKGARRRCTYTLQTSTSPAIHGKDAALIFLRGHVLLPPLHANQPLGRPSTTVGNSRSLAGSCPGHRARAPCHDGACTKVAGGALRAASLKDTDILSRDYHVAGPRLTRSTRPISTNTLGGPSASPRQNRRS
jgi:hypothetical protein